jgi:putative transposase
MRYRRLRVLGGIYFFTLVTHERQALFSDSSAIALLHSAIERIRARHPFTIDAYVIMPDHLHMIWTLPPSDDDFSTKWMAIKSQFVRELKKRHGHNVQLPVWQGRFWEHLIRDERDFGNHVEYIHYNPVHHGYVAAPRDWLHSSFHDFVARGDYDADWGSDEMPTLPKTIRE